MKTILIWIAAAFIGVIIIAALWYVAFAPKPAPQPPSPTPTTLPIGGSISPGTISPGAVPPAATSSAVRTVSLAVKGGTVAANDFINNGTTIPDAANAGRYLLAGDLGFCPTDPQKCQAGPVVGFNIYYDSEHQSFNIALVVEPIGQTRLAMQQYLGTVLGLTEAQMCSLNYLASVPLSINEQYAGKNLGFSFCPGATPLPI